MKHLILLACGLVMVSLPVHRTSVEFVTTQKAYGSCLSDSDLAKSLTTFTSPALKPEIQRERLIGYASRSPGCRTRIIAALMRDMDKPNLNLEVPETFFVWHFGGELLRALRASEALDLLIRNLGATDGESINITHYPAVETVIGIGESSIPKLGEKLKQEEKPGIRRLAIYSIAEIGGVAAKQTLTSALPNEKDSCNSKFIQVTLRLFHDRRHPNRLPTQNDEKWLSGLFCEL